MLFRSSHRVGREANAEFGETMNGIRPAGLVGKGDRSVDPWVRPGDPTSGLLPFIDRALWGRPGDADARATYGDGFVDSGWKDTVLVAPGERVKIAKPFGDFKGRFMYHCHNLEHEDMGMMREFSVE